jgi:quercetin dioxygenase-like cupin family protein
MDHREMRGALAACMAGLLIGLASHPTSAQTPPAQAPGAFRVDLVAERHLDRLPPGPLYWRVETDPAGSAAPPVNPDLSLSGEADGQVWRFTLGPPGERTPGMRFEAEVGPVPVPEASAWVLRLNRAGGRPGARTPVHSHPGSEAFFVRSGRLCQRTSHGEADLEAGQAMNGHEPGMAMQLTSCGADPLDQWVVFVLDASRPFSSPASFD